MKTIIKLLIAVVIPLSGAYAQKNEKLEAKDLKVLLVKEKLSDKEINKAYDNLSRLVESKVSYTMKDLLDLCLLYSKHDRSDAVYGFAYSLKDSSPKEFDKALKLLSKEDAAKIKEFVEIAQDTEKSGNG